MYVCMSVCVWKINIKLSNDECYRILNKTKTKMMLG